MKKKKTSKLNFVSWKFLESCLVIFIILLMLENCLQPKFTQKLT